MGNIDWEDAYKILKKAIQENPSILEEKDSFDEEIEKDPVELQKEVAMKACEPVIYYYGH